uniref:Inhibitor I9 domain-containing protein n=2 Tax=Phakopsora pachyrhizi TaxID=170000 RepID=A0A0S1MIJ6_PHAPC
MSLSFKALLVFLPLIFFYLVLAVKQPSDQTTHSTQPQKHNTHQTSINSKRELQQQLSQFNPHHQSLASSTRMSSVNDRTASPITDIDSNTNVPTAAKGEEESTKQKLEDQPAGDGTKASLSANPGESQQSDEKNLKSQNVSPSQEHMSRYIVTLSRETTSAQLKEYADKIIQRGGKINHTYDSAILKGFAVSISDSLVTTLDDDPNVKSVEPDGEVHI